MKSIKVLIPEGVKTLSIKVPGKYSIECYQVKTTMVAVLKKRSLLKRLKGLFCK